MSNITLRELCQLVKSQSATCKGVVLQVAEEIENNILGLLNQDTIVGTLVTPQYIIPSSVIQDFTSSSGMVQTSYHLKETTVSNITATVSGQNVGDIITENIIGNQVLAAGLRCISSFIGSVHTDVSVILSEFTQNLADNNINDSFSENTMKMRELIRSNIIKYQDPASAASAIINAFYENKQCATSSISIQDAMLADGAKFTGITPVGLIKDAINWNVDWSSLWSGIGTAMTSVWRGVRHLFNTFLDQINRLITNASVWFDRNVINPFDLVPLDDGDDMSIREGCIKITNTAPSQALDTFIAHFKNLASGILTANPGYAAVKVNTPFGYFVLTVTDGLMFKPYMIDPSLGEFIETEFRYTGELGTVYGCRNSIANLINDLSTNGKYGKDSCAQYISFVSYGDEHINQGLEASSYAAVKKAFAGALCYIVYVTYGGRSDEGLGLDMQRIYDYIMDNMYQAQNESQPTNEDWFNLVYETIDLGSYDQTYESDWTSFATYFDMFMSNLGSYEVVNDLPLPSVGIKTDTELKSEAMKTFKGITIGVGVAIAAVAAIKFVKFAKSKAITTMAAYNAKLYDPTASDVDIARSYWKAKLWNSLSLGTASKITGADFSASSITLIPIYKAITGKNLK